jgi:hypothetical protein
MKVREFFAKIAPFLDKVPAELTADANVNLPEIMDSDVVSIEVGYSTTSMERGYHMNITIFPVVDEAKVTLGEQLEATDRDSRESQAAEVLPA